MDDAIDKVANLTHGNLFIQDGFRCDVKRLRPVPNVAPLMWRTKLDSERLWSDGWFRRSNNFRREKICVLNKIRVRSNNSRL